MIRVVIVDDHPVVRFGLSAIIGVQADMAVAAEAGSGEEACSICSEQTADVVLMDLRLPRMGGRSARPIPGCASSSSPPTRETRTSTRPSKRAHRPIF
jgi:DNA-binding response OmpR family regulator